MQSPEAGRNLAHVDSEFLVSEELLHMLPDNLYSMTLHTAIGLNFL